jgi:prepilin-type processing-associated H-X9-DG protein
MLRSASPGLRARIALSLVELVVVVGILGILISLLFPAIQYMREAANRTTCANNLKQIGTALYVYYGNSGHFPPGSVSSPYYPGSPVPPDGVPYGNTNPGIGALPFLLPYLDEDNLYQEVPPVLFDSQANFPQWAYAFSPLDSTAFNMFNATGVPPWSLTHLRVFECPSTNNTAPFSSNAMWTGVIDLVYCAPSSATMYWNGQPYWAPVPGGTVTNTTGWQDYLPPTSPGFTGPNVANMGCTNYMANGGTIGQCNPTETLQSFLGNGYNNTPGFACPGLPYGTAPYATLANVPALPMPKYAGPFGINTQTQISQITDGASRTIAFCETLGGLQFSDGSTDRRLSWVAGMACPTIGGNQTTPILAPSISSNHSGVSNFLWCDGSVRPIAKAVLPAFDSLPSSWYAFQAAAGMTDGQPANVDE